MLKEMMSGWCKDEYATAVDYKEQGVNSSTRKTQTKISDGCLSETGKIW